MGCDLLSNQPIDTIQGGRSCLHGVEIEYVSRESGKCAHVETFFDGLFGMLLKIEQHLYAIDELSRVSKSYRKTGSDK